jgi:predicted nucleotidyltransferase
MATLSTAEDIITEEIRRSGLNALHILLFGSRARGDFDNRSDWDFFVTADKDLSFNERRKIAERIRWRLAAAGLASDVIIRSASAVSKARQNTGCLAYYVFKEGIEL